jgi:hypothetical protein
MNNRLNNKGGQLGLDAQKPSKGTEAGDSHARLLLQRLKIEAALRHQDLATWVSTNEILLKRADHIAIITVSLNKRGNITVQIRAALGEVMLIQEARAFVAEKNPSILPSEIFVDDDGAVSILWSGDFANEVDPSTVLGRLKEISDAVESIQPVLEEEFYLKHPDFLA